MSIRKAPAVTAVSSIPKLYSSKSEESWNIVPPMETPPSAGPLEICLEDKLAKFGQSPQNIEDHAKGPCVKS